MRKDARQKPYKIMAIDPFLKPYRQDIDLRMQHYTKIRKTLLGGRMDLVSMANGHLYYGFHRTEDGWVYREWAPGADALFLIGEFNGWNRASHPMAKLPGGVWEIELKGKDALEHGQRVKVHVVKGGRGVDHIPTYIRRVVQDKRDHSFSGQIWAPKKPFKWTDGGYAKRKISPLYIYEAHVGMAQEAERVGTYKEFTEHVLPRIKAAGYNTVQLMAIQEHPYYASFGYQVTNFFAASSWYGEPEDLKELINTAHGMDMLVLLDLVHSHAAMNVAEGLNRFDGTDDQFFRTGERGVHPAWGSKLFNYGKHEVIHFLLSNVKFWQDEYHFDGFRFDGVTSMLYHDHGLGEAFGQYDKYFSMNTDVEAVTYLQLANELIHENNAFAVTVAEDMSGMPGMCLPLRAGGIGFDYRLAMGVPDYWVKTLKLSDEQWDMHKMWFELTTRRPQEMSVGYAESHDQALVGDKTLIFQLADKEMYEAMDKQRPSLIIDRAVALHKLIRFVTLTLASEAYLNFMGNEFGHPEWIDFPREGNGWSFKYARRQWSLADDGSLKYQWLLLFDAAMLRFARKYRVMVKRDLTNLWIDQPGKLLAFSKGGLLYLFNFHPTQSREKFFLPAHTPGEGEYEVVFDSDAPEFGGQGRIDRRTIYRAEPHPGKGIGFYVYTPCRTAMVLKKVSGGVEEK
ncbi:MAG: alpha amylase C-terminal domain-containing protein [Christensenellaceae bacterium]|nr:alpha amylase C-terminal domain-containing protein [Christensenellaceae bacterium]MEA5067520.1 alpha amylase C-terminal domain-containing protein [Christensenellaceae bacterium]